MTFRVYQAADNQWIVFDSETKHFFNNRSDAENMANKLNFATQTQINATALAQLVDKLIDQESVYFDRGYNSAGSDPIVDDNISSLGITATELGNMITLIQQLENFISNSAVTAADYDATLNAIRSDV